MSDKTAAVHLGGVEVKLRTLDAFTYTRIRVQPGLDYLTRTLAFLRACWASPNRPANAANALDYEATARQTFAELMERGATPEQISAAGEAAFLLCWAAYRTDAGDEADEQDAESAADFSEAPDGSSAST